MGIYAKTVENMCWKILIYIMTGWTQPLHCGNNPLNEY